ncbi:MAG: acetate--CoA ligase family protein [Heliobacteriaceae bacterium]|jgi:acetyltransferase|nr:acetate--CoA ligase family protein [Heliobacteriaceae bacterium]
MNILNKIMKPQSIAVIGASAKDGTVGSEIMKRLTEYKFQGEIYPINPKCGEMYGLPVHTSVLEVSGEIDLAVIVVNSKFVLDTVDQCNEKGIKGLVIISAGFKEVGGEGAELEKQLTAKIKEYGMRIVGPNSVGIINTNQSMDASFAQALPVKGDVAFSSQSGALGCGILNILKDLNIGFSQFVSAGNQADINAEDLLEYWENDENTKQIMLYLEGIVNPSNFRKIASRISKKKPVVALKSGRSAAGASAASSHTGSLAGADKAADALLKQSGVIRELELKDLFGTAQAFANSPLPKGNRVAILTNSGGPGIMATDALCEYGMEIAKLSPSTTEYLKSYLPAAASVKNPVDMIASATAEQYQKSLEACLKDENVDMVMVIYLLLMGETDVNMAKAIMDMCAQYPDKPVIGVFMTTADFFNKLSGFETVNMPFYPYAEEGARAMKRLLQYADWVNKPQGKIPVYDVDKAKVEKIIANSAAEGRDQLTTLESIDVLQAYGIRACKYGLATSIEQVKELGNSIGYPVVMKMTSKTTSHKTDVGGVVVNIRSEEQLENEYNALLKRLEDKGLLEGLEGVIIQEMVKGSREMVCGIATDPQYGPMMMFGLGGVFIEVMKDVTFRLAPLTDDEALEMIKSVKAYHLLEGARGTKPAQIEQIQETLLRLSQLVNDFKFIDELDINPLLISEATGEGVAVDGRIKVRLEEAKLSLSCTCSSCCC